MDELTKHILDLQKEQDEHPERFILTVICDGCGGRHEEWFQKDEVAKYLERHNGDNELHHWVCEKCEPKDEDEDED